MITEAVYLLRTDPRLVRQLLNSTIDDVFALLPLDQHDIAPIDAILHRYEDQGFQLADAAIMHLSDREGIDTILTLNRRGFDVYRPMNGRSLTIIPN